MQKYYFSKYPLTFPLLLTLSLTKTLLNAPFLLHVSTRLRGKGYSFQKKAVS